VSNAGDVIAATDVTTTPTPYKWTLADGVVDLPQAPGADQTYILGLSGDGTTAVGYAHMIADSSWVAFVYSFTTSMIITRPRAALFY
jgi:hypothetical protein